MSFVDRVNMQSNMCLATDCVQPKYRPSFTVLLNARAGLPIVEWYEISAPDIAAPARNKSEGNQSKCLGIISYDKLQNDILDINTF